MNHCNLKILFEFIVMNDEYMGVEIKSGNKELVVVEPNNGSLYCFEQTIFLPHKINLRFFGKNQDKDTEVDINGNIVRDKALIIKDIRLDDIPVSKYYLQRHIKIKHQNGEILSNYIGFNCESLIEFDQMTAFHQLMEIKRLGEG